MIGLKKILSTSAALALVFGVAAPASANYRHRSDNDLVVNKNSAYTSNTVIAKSDTGDNYAGGSTGGDGGSSGDLKNYGGSDVDNSSTGNGGAGGSANDGGGTVLTGEASTNVDVLNAVNSNYTKIDRCGCDGESTDGDAKVINRNRAKTRNFVVAKSDTGDNEADGSQGGNGGSSGDLKSGWNSDDIKDSSTGNGGNGGSATGESGGYVNTSSATTDVHVVNFVNRNVTRVRR